MTNLQERNQNKLSYLSEIQQSIESLRQQIEALNLKFTEETKFANAQANLTKQWKEAIEPLKDLLVSACGVYGDESVIDDMLGDLENIVDDVRNNFEENKAKPNPFLDEAKKVDVPSVQPLLFDTSIVANNNNEEELPSPDDDKTLLTATQIKTIIKMYDLDIMKVKKLAVLLEMDVPRSIKAFADQGDNLLTRSMLEEYIQTIIPTQPRILNVA